MQAMPQHVCLAVAVMMALIIASCDGGTSTFVDPTDLSASTFARSTADVDETNVEEGDEQIHAHSGIGARSDTLVSSLRSGPGLAGGNRLLHPVASLFETIPILRHEAEKMGVMTGFIRDPQSVSRIMPNLSASNFISLAVEETYMCDTSGTVTVNSSAANNASELLNGLLNVDFDMCNHNGTTVDGDFSLFTTISGVTLNETTSEPEFGNIIRITETFESTGITIEDGEFAGTIEFEALLVEAGSEFTATASVTFTNWTGNFGVAALEAGTEDINVPRLLIAAAATMTISSEGEPACPATVIVVFEASQSFFIASPELSAFAVSSRSELTGADCSTSSRRNIVYLTTSGSIDTSRYLAYTINGSSQVVFTDADDSDITCTVTDMGTSCEMSCTGGSGGPFTASSGQGCGGQFAVRTP